MSSVLSGDSPSLSEGNPRKKSMGSPTVSVSTTATLLISQRPTAVPTKAHFFRTKNATSATAVISVGDFVEASFAQFERHYNSQYESSNEPSSSSSSSSSWPYWLNWCFTVLTSMIPILFLWTRRSMLGISSLLRPLFTILTIFSSISVPGVIFDKIETFTPALLGVSDNIPSKFLDVVGHAFLGKVDPNSCPPPAFVLLALITCVALVVHPDGLTWVLMGRLRECIQYLFRSSAIYLSMIREGSIPTLASSGYLAGLIALITLIHRVTNQNHHNSNKTGDENHANNNNKGSKHKHKRNGRKGNHGRIRTHNNNNNNTKQKIQQGTKSISLNKTTSTDNCNDKSEVDIFHNVFGRKISNTSVENNPNDDNGSEVISCCSLPSNANFNSTQGELAGVIEGGSASVNAVTTGNTKINDKNTIRSHRGRTQNYRRRRNINQNKLKVTHDRQTKTDCNNFHDAHHNDNNDTPPSHSSTSKQSVLSNFVSTLRSLSPQPKLGNTSRDSLKSGESDGVSLPTNGIMDYRTYTSSSFFSNPSPRCITDSNSKNHTHNHQQQPPIFNTLPYHQPNHIHNILTPLNNTNINNNTSQHHSYPNNKTIPTAIVRPPPGFRHNNTVNQNATHPLYAPLQHQPTVIPHLYPAPAHTCNETSPNTIHRTHLLAVDHNNANVLPRVYGREIQDVSPSSSSSSWDIIPGAVVEDEEADLLAQVGGQMAVSILDF